jgi:sterol desaturase/sphingolipid hydroxylase (fatty acid hydroxylase superfamily)
MLGIPIGLAVFGIGEWAVHKFVLHGLGRDPRGAHAVHYHRHHQAAHKNGGYDPDYEGPMWSSRAQRRELFGLTAVGLAHVPLFVVAPFYTSTIWYCLARYRRDHRRAHLDPAWARDHLPWHYDHHMGDQEKNFGVSWSWFDVLAGTRDVFVGSERERANRASHVARAQTASAGAALRAQRRRPRRASVFSPAPRAPAIRG